MNFFSLDNTTNSDVDEDTDLTEDELNYLATTVKAKEVVIILFMLLLWLFSIHRYSDQIAKKN